MRTAFLMFGVCLAAGFSSGCATLVSGKHQEVHFTSDPPGVEVRADNGTAIETPGDLNLTRNKQHCIVARHNDAEPQEKMLQSGLNGWVFGNILLGGIVGVVVDMVSGAAGQLEPETVHFDFTETGQARAARQKAYLDANPDLSKSVRFAVMHERPIRQMTREGLVATLGEPDEIVEEGKYEKYVYSDREPRYYYLRKDVIHHTKK